MTTKARILRTATELFASRGYYGTGVRQIARRARVHESTIFRIFGSKRGLASAAFESQMEHAARTGINHDKGHDLYTAAKLYAAWLAHAMNPRMMRLYLALALGQPEALRQRILPSCMAMIKAIQSAQERGEIIAGDPKEILAALHASIVGNSTLRAVMHPISNSPALAHEWTLMAVDIWLHGASACAHMCKSYALTAKLHGEKYVVTQATTARPASAGA